ncbi:MATH domain and coiled-coil domain-containing protein At3g58340-like [Vicia villosa]|uniref:MATH domain and coiled-coil domain-containing protein At3g58340-like n=1 Tax=Vicia villosa TaxID=3911 RepID=UPI00273CD476|nr:MATH domain and coiled-coil domain-containing protein At3g58340-like [Vicia villosa]
MERHQSNVEKFEKLSWKVENFSRLIKDEIYSQPFVLGGYPWRIILLPNGKEGAEKSLSIYLEAFETANMSKGWSRDVKYKLLVFNQFDANMTITEEFEDKFDSCSDTIGSEDFMEFEVLCDLGKGFIFDDACIVGVEIFVSKSIYEKPLHGTARLRTSISIGTRTTNLKGKVLRLNPEISGPSRESPQNFVTELFSSPSIEELLDLSNARQIKKICSDHSLVIDRPLKKELAFAALGRIFYFLKTRKVKDMNGQTCEGLQVLWKELEQFEFDLSWLEPHVQSALEVKSYVENVLQIEKVKEDMVILELERERLKAKLAAVELNHNIERESLKAKGFEDMDMDSELGCWSCRLF